MDINRSGQHTAPAAVNLFTAAGGLCCPLRLMSIYRSGPIMLLAAVNRLTAAGTSVTGRPWLAAELLQRVTEAPAAGRQSATLR
jgi:hypothetical protein